MVPAFQPEKAVITRASGGIALSAIAGKLPLVVSGSADLHGPTKNYLKESDGDFSGENPRAQHPSVSASTQWVQSSAASLTKAL